MRYFFVAISMLFFISCEQQSEKSTVEQSDNQDPIRSSQTYKSYVIAHAEYKSCVNQRAELTDKLTSNQISREEFDKNIGTNTRVCQLKKQVVDLYWRVLDEEFDNITSDYNLMPSPDK